MKDQGGQGTGRLGSRVRGEGKGEDQAVLLISVVHHLSGYSDMLMDLVHDERDSWTYDAARVLVQLGQGDGLGPWTALLHKTIEMMESILA